MTRNFLLAMFAVVISAILIFPQTKSVGNVDSSPNLKNNEITGTRAMWDLEFSFDLNVASGAAGNAGAEFDGTYFYTTRWATNLIHKYDMTGTLVEEFSIPGVSGLRDLAFDGTYFYGGAASTTIYQMDFTTKTLVGTITSPVAVRFIAYDDDNDAFWCGNWDTTPTLVSRTGTNMGTITTGLAGQYGAAYDNVSVGGPFLWIFDQGGGACPGSLVMYQFDIATGTATGVSHDACDELTDGIAGGLFSTVDFVAGKFSIGGVMQSNSGLDDTFFIYEVADSGPQPGPGPASNPAPANGATDVDVNQDLSWDNATGATSIEIFFGPVGNLTSVYSGAPVTTYDVGTLDYFTSYGWRVNQTDGSGTTVSPMWSFQTMQNPAFVFTTDTVYPQSADYWTGTTDGTTKTDVSEVRGQNTEDGWLMFDISSVPGNAIVDSMRFYGYVNFTNYPFWSATPLPGLNPLTASAADLKTAISSNSGTALAYVYANETSTFAIGWHDYLMGNSCNTDFEAALAQGWFAMGMDSRDNSATYYINWDGWNETNVPYLKVSYHFIVPVELSSFTANVSNGNVVLNWVTATETNNKGFEIQRSSGGDFQTIGFVQGNGTSTQQHSYTYSDNTVDHGSYSYRLRQVDFDGSSEFSKVVEVNISAPKVYSLAQNYPNPFNPTTQINFSLATDSKVTLKVFDILGQEITTLLNGNLLAGPHFVNFDASKLTSGVYLYRMDATGADGSTFTAIKKMLLTK